MKKTYILFLILILSLFTACSDDKEKTNHKQVQQDVSTTFTESLIDSSISEPWGKSVGDVNGDGLTDMLVQGNLSGGLVWFEAPNWTKHTINSSAGYTTDLEVGDIDGDGDADIVSTKNDGLYLYTQSSGWQESQITSSVFHDVELADLDLDGDLDVIARNQTPFADDGDSVHFYENDGSWTHTSEVVPDGEGLTVIDINDDFRPDVIVNQVWLENTEFNWLSHTYTSSYIHPHTQIAVGDVDNDGRLDIALSPSEQGGSTYHISWFKAPLDRTQEWSENIVKTNVETYAHFVGLADFDGDEQLDIAYAEMSQSNGDDVVAVIYNSNQQWLEEILSVDGSHSMRIFHADNDGDPDLFGANWRANGRDENVKLWRNNRAPHDLTSWQRHTIDTSKPERSIYVRVADIDNDGFKDVLTGRYWYKNPGTAGGTWNRTPFGGSLNNVIGVVDADDDGDQDILAGQGIGDTANSVISWGENNSGVFTETQAIDLGSGDFLQGFAFTEIKSGNLKAALSWHQTGLGIKELTVSGDPETGSWSAPTISSFSEDEDISIGDIDKDYDNDIFQGSGWLRNDSGSYTRIEVYTPPAPPDRNSLADIDGDGDLDAVVGFENDSNLVWLENVSPESAWPEHSISTLVGGGYSMNVHDMDRDGDIDVILGEHQGSNRLLIFENVNYGNSWTQHIVDSGGSGIDHHDGTVISDIDNDGDSDIISIGWTNPSNVWIFENLSETIVVPDGGVSDSGSDVDSSTDGGVIDSSTDSGDSSIDSGTDSGQETGVDAAPDSSPDGGSSGGGTVPQNGLQAHWALDEGSGTVASDQSANDYDGTVNGADWVAGKINGALEFSNSEGDYVDIGNIDITTGTGITLAAWVKPTAFSGSFFDNRIISKAYSSNGDAHWWMISGINVNGNPHLRFRLKAGGSTSTLVAQNGELILNQWQHVTATYDGSTMRLWLNGTEVGSLSKSGSVGVATWVNANIGRNPEGYGSWNGSIDQVLIYDRALTSSEIQGLVAAEPPQNEAPTVNAGADQSIELPPGDVVLNGSATDDGLPGSLTIQWSVISGPSGVSFDDSSNPQATASFNSIGSYTLRLTADDGELSDFDEVIINVQDPPNTAPIVNAGEDQTIELPPGDTALNGSVTDDGVPSTGSLTTQWIVTSGPGAATFVDNSDPQTSVSFDTIGTYVLRLTGDDGDISTFDEVNVVVEEPPNQIPIANFVSNNPTSITFDGSNSIDNDGNFVEYQWDFGDGTSGSGVTPTHNYAPGSYIVTLTVVDDDGGEATIQKLLELPY